MSITASLALRATSAAALALIRHHDHLVPILKSTCLFPLKRVRVSCAAILLLCKDDRYLLIRNEHRPEEFGPIGGVFKYYATAERALEDLSFEPQLTRAGNTAPLDGDLRGFVPSLVLGPFLSWLKRRRDREQSECIRRELHEEVTAIGQGEALKLFAEARFNLVRTVHEGPATVAGMRYVQFRYIEVYSALDANDGIDFLYNAADTDDDVITATRREIRACRTDRGHVIGSHASYLIGKQRFGGEPVPMVGSADID